MLRYTTSLIYNLWRITSSSFDTSESNLSYDEINELDSSSEENKSKESCSSKNTCSTSNNHLKAIENINNIKINVITNDQNKILDLIERT